MSLYPSLEDMQVDKMLQSQNRVVAAAAAAQQQQQQQLYHPSAPTSKVPPVYSLYPSFDAIEAGASAPEKAAGHNALAPTAMYPDLYEYMGLELSKAMIEANLPQFMHAQQSPNAQAVAIPQESTVATVNNANMVAPVTGGFVGLQRGQVTNGIREVSPSENVHIIAWFPFSLRANNNAFVYSSDHHFRSQQLILCKGADKKVGLRAHAVNKGVFVCVVVKDSPAAMAGLRFGDQILQINGTLVAGFSDDDVHKLLKKSDKNNISIVVRDR